MHRGTEPPDDSRPTTGESPLSFLPVLANQNQRSFIYIYIYRYLFTIFASLAYDRTERKLDRLCVSRFLSSFSISRCTYFDKIVRTKISLPNGRRGCRLRLAYFMRLLKEISRSILQRGGGRFFAHFVILVWPVNVKVAARN